MVEPIVQIDPGVDLQTAAGAPLKVAENVEIVCCMQCLDRLTAARCLVSLLLVNKRRDDLGRERIPE